MFTGETIETFSHIILIFFLQNFRFSITKPSGKHEDECGYRLQECFGCQAKILDKDLALHKQTCESIELICSDCQFVYIRRDASLHTQVECLCKQLTQRDATIANLRTDFEKYRHHQEEMVKKIIAYNRSS